MPKDTYKTRTEFIVVGVVQLVEQQIVVLFVVGSSPIVHPIYKKPVSNNWLFLFQLINFTNKQFPILIKLHFA
tara:strand:+ start:3615 stop:3833 length:219 start_codon:yes stop_codon:yes gene_type:complete